MGKIQLVKIILVILLIASGFIYLLLERNQTAQNSEEISINGVIQQIEYNEKGFPTIMVDSEYYELPFANLGQLEIGDSVVKNISSNALYQYRENELINSFYGFVVKN